ncbi:SpaH/EbpB family LPXTG-anchored major pilin [Gardnerella piotii]|uniref:SpaH/EbpB family LPXTG-anchored major pilin n=1 Tax=Gardnerella piotii TaxID=2792977 RepID=A0AAU8NNG1_9BIFI
MNKITKQCVAAVASLAMAGTLCVAGAVVAGSSAWAADGTACAVDKAPWATDQTKNCVGSIKITKYKDEVGDDGNQKKTTKVSGAKFKVTKVTSFDLTKYDKWLDVAAKVQTLNATPNSTDGLTFGTSEEKQTGADGVADFKNLGIGLYKVEETQAADGYQKLANPFFMTVPEVTRQKNGDNAYKYSVTVDPKNAYTKDAINKTADTKGMVGAEDSLPYTIKTTVVTTTNTPVTQRTKDDYKDFAVWDDALISAYDGMKNLTNGQAKALVTEVKIGDTPITNTKGKEDKYTVSVGYSPVDNNGGTATRKRITVAFTDAENGGLDAIAKALAKKPNDKLTVTFKFKLSKTVAAGELVNKYGFQQGHNTKDPKPTPDPDPEPGPGSKVTLRDFQIKKVNGAKETEALKGAKFAVFAKKDDADACVADKTRAAASCSQKASYAAGFTNETNGTGENGLTTAFKAKVGEEFYVVETKAPDGFVLSPAVDKVTIPANAGTDTAFVHNFKDLPNGGPDGGKNWFTLPKTGAAGVIIFALIGLGLVGSGMFVFLKNRKKEEEQAA